jgi:hypothetical protein
MSKSASLKDPPKDFTELLELWEMPTPEVPKDLDLKVDSEFGQNVSEAMTKEEIQDHLDYKPRLSQKADGVIPEDVPKLDGREGEAPKGLETKAEAKPKPKAKAKAEAEAKAKPEAKTEDRLSENALRVMAMVAGEVRFRAVIFVLVGLLSSAAMAYGGYLLPIVPVLAVTLVGFTTSLWRLWLLKNHRYLPFFTWLLSGPKQKPGREELTQPDIGQSFAPRPDDKGDSK